MDVAEFLPGARRDLLLICDHASNSVPAELADLGLDAFALAQHVAWDIGAGPLTARLAERLGAPALLCRYSRLVIDPNRAEGRADSIPALSHGVRVPGNEGLDAAERERRAAAYHRPWHARIAAEIRRLAAPALIAVHSFAPEVGGAGRPWHAAVLHDDDVRLARPLLRALRRRRELHVGDNEPYTGYSDLTFTLPHQAGAAGLPSAAIEVRQDLIAAPAGIERWAEILDRALREMLEARP